VSTQRKAMDTVDGASSRLLRIEDIAERLSVSRSMAWKLIAIGQLRAIRIGRAVRVRPADLEAYIERAAGEG
jgi:excisionase family DNA binding protein